MTAERAHADQATAALASAQETIAERDREIAGLREALGIGEDGDGDEQLRALYAARATPAGDG